MNHDKAVRAVRSAKAHFQTSPNLDKVRNY